MGSLRATTLPVTRVPPADREAMWALFERVYADVDRLRFDADLDAKHDVILLRDGDVVRGFSTVVVDRLHVGGRRVVSIYSGDTVIDPSYWGQTALQRAFFRYLVRVRVENPGALVVWFLLTKGYKTWLLLSRNFVTYWPRRDRPMPADAREILGTLATARFGAAFDPATLVLRVEGRHGRLREGVAPVEGVDDPDVRWFVEANPGHAQGDELCCLGVVDATLLLTWPFRVLLKRRRPARPPPPG